ncbi:MAG: SDR family NAD(P)-dependent oxidoreductase [Bacteroidales bacterium]
MINLRTKYGNLALVAGASEGIGAAFSEYLATEGIDLILIARRSEPLEKLSERLKSEYKINVETFCCDLSETDSYAKILGFLGKRAIDIFIYNAALSYIGKFERNTIENHEKLLIANIVTPTKLIQHFGTKMLEKGSGALILMSSLAGYQGSGFLSAYASSKAYSRILAQSLWYEWKERGVHVLGCCAGATASPNYLNTKPEKTGFFVPKVQLPADVVKESFNALGIVPSIITGKGNRLAGFFMHRVFPVKTAINIMGKNTRKMYSKFINMPG